jgi:hypothetical protein
MTLWALILRTVAPFHEADACKRYAFPVRAPDTDDASPGFGPEEAGADPSYRSGITNPIRPPRRPAADAATLGDGSESLEAESISACVADGDFTWVGYGKRGMTD